VFLVSDTADGPANHVWFSYYKHLRKSGGRLKLGYGPGRPAGARHPHQYGPPPRTDPPAVHRSGGRPAVGQDVRDVSSDVSTRNDRFGAQRSAAAGDPFGDDRRPVQVDAIKRFDRWSAKA
jgi:hypothetical protein